MNAMLKIGDFVDVVEPAGVRELPLPQRWYLLRVHPLREARVMKAFELRDVSAYLPMVTRDVVVSRLGGRQVKVRRPEPLFPGLVFVPDFEVGRTRLRDVEGVIGLFQMADCTPYLPLKEMADVRALVAAGIAPASKLKRQYQVGALVRVVDGPFVGFQGRIERLDSKGRLRVLLSALKRGQSVQITESQIEPVSPDNVGSMVRQPEHRARRRRS